MKILVTGSSGHLGEALVRVLQAANYEVVGIDILPSEFTTSVGSILDKDFVRNCMTDVDTVLHTATLHKPHVATHSNQDFIDTNVTGTLSLLEQAHISEVKSFIYTSTTSTFGHALNPPLHATAAWITEDVVPIPKNIYGVTKLAAEDLCELFYRNHNLPCIVLKTSRFFPEEDDKRELREAYQQANLKANEFLNRRVDLEDIVDAHILAFTNALSIRFAKYIISATSPFTIDDIYNLQKEAPDILRKKFPDFEEIYEQRDWKMFPGVDRVYVNERARVELGWKPKYDFDHVLSCVRKGEDFQSPLARAVGKKGYHTMEFKEGPYPVK